MTSAHETSRSSNSQAHDFMDSPLVTWVKTFHEDDSTELEYKQLTDGVFLYDVMLQIDPRPPNRGIIRSVDDVTARTRNFDILIRNLRYFYQENLGQLILLKSPDVVSIGAEPEAEASIQDLQMLLLLILGSAVQCDKKEKFVENIKQLDYNIQHAIVSYIQQVTDNPESIWINDWDDLTSLSNEQLQNIYKFLVQHIKRIVHERDSISQRLTELVLYQESSRSICNGQLSPNRPNIGSPRSDKHHFGVELADSKAKLRKARQELEEKTEILTEVKDELDHCKCTFNKLRQENLELVQEARAAKAYRDEIDILKERATKVDKLENEIQRYKDKMNELEFYKSRVDELREDNRILVETKEMLEDQLESSRKRADQVLELENEILRNKAKINDLILEKDADKEKIKELIEDNTQLELDRKSCMNESAMLQSELKNFKSQNNSLLETSLSEQLNDNAQAKVFKLELEIQRLQSALDGFKESSFHDSSEKILELEKENKRLSLKVDQLQESNQKQTHKLIDLEQEHQKCLHEATKLQNIIETLRTSSERQQNESQLEKSQLSEIVDTLRERNKKSEHARLQDIENENKKLIEQSQNSKSQISKLSFENQQLQKTVERLKGDCSEMVEVQLLRDEMERENVDLQQKVLAFQSTCQNHEELDSEHNELKTDFVRLKKSLESLKIKYSKMEKTEHENIYLKGENQKINKALDTLKNSATRLLDLEHEKEELANQNKLLQKNVDTLRLNCSKLELIEVDMMSVSNENQRLHKTIETCNKKLDDLSSDSQDLETENHKLQKTVETLKVSTRRYNELEREVTDLEANNDKLSRENKSLEKESNRLRQSLEVKDSTIDEISSQLSSVGRENKNLQKDLDLNVHSSQKLKDFEKENKELIQQLTVDKKTLVILREDLVNEKIKAQQLQNELEKMNSELQKIGINKDKLINAEQEADQNRYKMLENLLEDTLKNSLEIKEEKIASLENRLTESQERCFDIKDQLNRVNSQCEMYRSKVEAVSQQTSPKNAKQSNSSLNDEILNLKNHVVDLEKKNASLKEESRVVEEHGSSWKEQASGLQYQIINMQKHCSNISEQNTQLQSNLAKLQVENTTLKSENQSLASQISVLQSQISAFETERDYLKSLRSELQAAQEALFIDNEALQKLHEQLSTDYERLLSEIAQHKSANKNMKFENKTVKDKLHSVLMTQDEVIKIKESLEEEKAKFRADCKSLMNLRTEHHSLKDDFRALHSNCEKIRTEYKGLQGEYKSLKTENNTLKLKNTELQGDLADARDTTSSLDIQISKVNSKCELLMQMNSTLEDDRKSLMNQLSSLLTQYHDLLTQTLTDKEIYHEEEKIFADRLNNLRRQKEMLEQKIMDQYRRMENSPKRRGFGANLVKRVRKAGTELISRVPKTGRSRERGSGVSDNPDNNDSTDNSSITDGTGSENGINRNSPDSVELDLSMDSSNILRSRKGKELTSCYSVMNMRKSLPPNSSLFDQHSKSNRGSFSSEDIRSILTDSHSSDSHPADEGSPTPVVKSNTADSDPPKDSQTLCLPGSRKAVYYTSNDGLNHEDTIPTRDIGPGISAAKTEEKIINQTTKITLNTSNLKPLYESSPKIDHIHTNGRSTPEGTSRNSPNIDSKNQKLIKSAINHQHTSMINIPMATSTPSKACAPSPLPRKNSTSILASLQRKPPHNNAERQDSNSSNTSSDTNRTSAGSVKSWRSITTDGSSSKPDVLEQNSDSNIQSTAASLRRNDKHSNSDAPATINSSNKMPKGTQDPKLSCLMTNGSPVKAKSDTNGNDTCKSDDSDAKEKRTDNSIWYEYGCV